MIEEQFFDVILLLCLIALNVLINYLYRENIVFPTLFILANLIYALSIIANSEIYILCLIIFSISYNSLTIIDRKK